MESALEGRLREAYSALAQGDTSPVLALCDERIEITEPKEIPDASVFHGHEGLLGVLAKLREIFPDMVFAPESFTAKDHCAIVTMRWVGHGAGSGASTETWLYHVWAFEAGRATRIDAFFGLEDAVKAAGFRPREDPAQTAATTETSD